ncbi:MAG: HAMP domain-containing sensor histidine kinase [Cryomorphaceae bacterium]
MRGSKLSIIIALMSASVIGIIGLQAYWIKKAVEEQSKEFDRRAKSALYATVKDLARSQTETIFSINFGEMDIEELLKKGELHSDNVAVHQDTIIIENGVTLKTQHRSKNHRVSNGSNVVVIETQSSISSQEQENFDVSGAEIIEEAIQNVVVRGLKEEPDIASRIGEKDLRKMLYDNLRREGVELDFSYAVIKDTLVTDYSSVDLVDANYFSASLFPEWPDHSSLYLGFPSKEMFLFQSMGRILFFVLLFSLLMIGSFIYAVRYMLQQKRLSAMKSDFINNMTHEFKTPLATIGLAAESIVHPKVKNDNNSLQRYSELIIHESKRLNYHVENILQMAKIERKELMLQKARVSFSDLALEAIDTHKLMIEKRNAQLEQNFCIDDPMVFADSHHLCNAISNPIDNALKYSPKNPEIDVSIESKNEYVLLTVADKGSGMGSEARERAFEAFYREQSGDVHTVKGFGVGLSYVKEIVERHNGEVFLKSKLGRGTEVTIKIPCNES